MAFAQPTFNQDENIDKAGKKVLCIYIDNSYSMNAKGTEGELLSEARETAKRLIEKTPENTAIFICSNQLDANEQRLLTKAEAFDYLEKLDYSPLARPLQDILIWQKSFLKKEDAEQEKIGNVTYVILSDFQSTTAKLSTKLNSSETYHLVKFTPQSSANLTIDSVWFAFPIHKPGFQNELFVRIKNHANEDFSNAEITLDLNGSIRSSFVDIPKNNVLTTSFKLTETSTGKKTGKFSVNDKQLFWDDDFYFSYTVNSAASILLLNGENSSSATLKAFEVEPYFSVQNIQQTSFNKSMLDNVDLLVLNGLNTASSGLISDVKEFIDNGGSAAIIPGKQLEFSSVNQLLNSLSLPSFSAKSSNASRIQEIKFKDSFFSGVFEKENPNLSMPSIANYYSLQNGYLGKSLMNLRNNQPLLLKNSNRCYLFTTAIQEDFSSLASNAIFPTTLLRMGELSIRSLPLYATIGIDNAVKLPVKNEMEKPIRLKGTSGDYIPPQQKRSSQLILSLTGPEATEKLKSGNFDLLGEENLGALSLNYSRTESDVTSKNKEEIISLFNDAGVKNVTFSEVKNGDKATALELEKTSELWRIFLILSLLFVLVEMALLKFMK